MNLSEGMPGFGGQVTEFAAGSVTGVRWWNLVTTGNRVQLNGASYNSQRHGWTPGANTARCPFPVLHENRGCRVPCECGCGCGFWAYWLLDDTRYGRSFPRPVLGVIEGYGTTTIGERGFRCARARILGLHLPLVTDRIPLAGPDGRMAGRQEITDVRRVAKMSLLRQLLGRTYGVPVYSSAEMLLASHPATTDYLP
jgi:hypothetical protein